MGQGDQYSIYWVALPPGCRSISSQATTDSCGPPFLPELEAGDVLGAVDQLENELAAAAGPALVGLPDVAVLATRRVVGEATGACCDRLLNLVNRRAAAARHLLHLGVACCEDVQPLVAAQAELDWDGAAGLGAVEGRQVVDWLEEARPVVDHLVSDALAGAVAGSVDGLDAEGVAADRGAVDTRAAGERASAGGQARAALLIGTGVAGHDALAKLVDCSIGGGADRDGWRGGVRVLLQLEGADVAVRTLWA